MTRRVTRQAPTHDKVILPARRLHPMDCEFCQERLPSVEPENVALLEHVRLSRACRDQFGFLLENLRTSWTRNMSGG